MKDVNASNISWSKITTPFKLKTRFACNIFNLVDVEICGTCEEEHIEETGEGKTKLKDTVRMYRYDFRQPQYQQLKVEGHWRVCGNGKFRIFPVLQMRSKYTNWRWSYETRFLQKFKTKLNKLWWETYAIKVNKNLSIVKQLFIACITFETDVTNLESNWISFRPVSITCFICFENMTSNNSFKKIYK